MIKRLLVDCDGYIFSTACIVQEKHPFDPEGMPIVDIDKGIKILKSRLDSLIEKFEADEALMFLSCSREKGHRRTMVDETYKANRNNTKSPLALSALREWTEENYTCVQEPVLEADDLVSIYASEPQNKYDNIIISFDKDVLGQPGKTYNPRKDEKRKVTKATALRFFIYQVICGDSADGIKGIKGIGKVGAKKFITSQPVLANIWEPLLELAATKGHNEEYMLKQARMIYMLRHGDYNFNTKEITLWTPDFIQRML